MDVGSRSYLTAGIAALGAGAIALSPIQPIPNQVAFAPQHAVSNLTVELAAAINPIQPWVDTIKAALTNTGTLFQDWSAGLYVAGTIPSPPNTALNGNLGYRTGGYASGDPFPILKQFIANQISHLQQLPDIGAIFQEVIGNAGNALRAPFQVGATERGTVLGIPGQYNQNVSGAVFGEPLPTFVINQRTVGALLPVLAGASYAALQPILDFATTPISGVLLGVVGPLLGPVLAAVDSVKAIFTALKASDLSGAINELLNIPANMVNAGLNGGPVLDLENILGPLLPASIKTIGLKMGGLLSPGGVAFDGLTAEADATIPGLGTLSLKVPGSPVGPIGAITTLTNYVAKSIKPPTSEPAPGATAAHQVKAAAAEVEATESVAEISAAVEAPAADVADDTPAPKRQSRAATRADKTGDSARANRAGRAARNAG